MIPETQEINHKQIYGLVKCKIFADTDHGVVHPFGPYITKDFGDYHVPSHADVANIEAYFVNKPDLLDDPMGSKSLGEIAIIGVAPAIANAVFNATWKRVRELPITPDKLV